MADNFPQGSGVDRILNATIIGGMFGSAGGIAKAIAARPQEFGGVAATTISVGDTLPTFARLSSHIVKHGGLCATAGAAFAFGDVLAETLRGKRDSFNGFCGGMGMGMVLGTHTRRMRIVLGYGLGFGILGAAIQLSGGTLSQWPEQFAARKNGLRPKIVQEE